jgi:hypothetical protein
MGVEARSLAHSAREKVLYGENNAASEVKGLEDTNCGIIALSVVDSNNWLHLAALPSNDEPAPTLVSSYT